MRKEKFNYSALNTDKRLARDREKDLKDKVTPEFVYDETTGEIATRPFSVKQFTAGGTGQIADIEGVAVNFSGGKAIALTKDKDVDNLVIDPSTGEIYGDITETYQEYNNRTRKYETKTRSWPAQQLSNEEATKIVTNPSVVRPDGTNFKNTAEFIRYMETKGNEADPFEAPAENTDNDAEIIDLLNFQE